eukprot:12236491-Heterocapsa_arctica.AAC.1
MNKETGCTFTFVSDPLTCFGLPARHRVAKSGPCGSMSLQQKIWPAGLQGQPGGGDVVICD